MLMAGEGGQGVWFTTLLDLYGIPGDFPAIGEAPIGPPRARAAHLEAAFDADIKDDDHWRFIGHLQLHEFEALILTDMDEVAGYFSSRTNAAVRLKAAVAGLAPEDVNEGPQTAPSKRIIACIPEYEGLKVIAGAIIAGIIGIDRIRAACPHFNAWLAEIEVRIGG